MAMMECRDCLKIADSRSFRRCAMSGAPLCDDCLIRNGGLCEDCSSQEE